MQSGRGFDITELRREAQKRWLKPSEVFFILQNYDNDQLTAEPPQNPPSGSLFLFNRRVLRFFRKDGHSWRKKKDGKTLGEAHEHLKVDNIDTLNCYYAHGDQNPHFQRRSYWMLDPACDHIVVVHYREVTEGRYNVGSKLLTDSNSTFSQGARFCYAQNPGSSGITETPDPYLSSVSPGYMEEVSSKLAVGNNDMNRFYGMDRLGDSSSSSEPEVTLALQMLTEQLSLDREDSNSVEKLPFCSQNENLQEPGFLASTKGGSSHGAFIDHLLGLPYGEHDLLLDTNTGMQDDSNSMPLLPNSVDTGKLHSQPPGPVFTIEREDSPSWKEMLEYYASSTGIDMQDKNSDQVIQEEFPYTTFKFEGGCQAKDMASHNSLLALASSERTIDSFIQAEQPEDLMCQWTEFRGNDADSKTNTHQTCESNFDLKFSSANEFLLGSEKPILSPTSSELFQEIENTTISAYSSGILDASSGVGMLTKHVPFNNHKYCPEYHEVLYDQESRSDFPLGLGSSLTISQIQCFSIREISPEWAFSTEGTKIIIIGDFLCGSSECTWACMFGEIEVPAEVIQAGVLRCHAPPHVAGKVNFCITAGNRESCSEVREFEYRVKPKSSGFDNNLPQANTTKSSEELRLLLEFAEMLLLGYDSVSVQKEDSSMSETEPSRELKMASDSWRQIIEELSVGSDTSSYTEIMDWLLQEFLKDKLRQWLSSKYQEGEVTVCPLSKEEQGVIHRIAGLGYEWGLNSVLNSGVGVNFRDDSGWTALHWAARFGREKMVAALVAAGASAVAVTDATSQDPVGKNPASIAAASGHKGLAGYLSEAALTSHLSSLTLEESELSKGFATVEAERAMETIAEKTEQVPIGEVEDQLSLKDSLAAVRNAAQAAARIQAAFRAHSFRKRQLRALVSCDEFDWTTEDIHEFSPTIKFQWAFYRLRNHKLNKAALSIQKKYRGWKRRREFLTLLKNVVKIQAHVRGHQTKKKYKEFLWTASVLEKAILRWRRRGVGFRGFRAEQESIDETKDDDILKVFRKQKVDAVIDEAMSRVLSMVESPEARHQYRRILERYRKAKAQLINTLSETALNYQANEDNMENDEDDMYHL